MAQYGDVCNYCLDLSGQLRIAQADFVNEDDLERPQVQIKRFIQTCDSLLMLRQNKLPYHRRYTFNTAADQSDYALSNTTNLEAIKYHSIWYNVEGQEYELSNRPYSQYKEQRLSQLASGKPLYWTALPSEENVATRTNYIRLSPTPDDVYEIEYVAKKTAPSLSAYTDVLLWDDIYIQPLYLAGASMLRAETDGMSLAEQASAAINAVRVWSTGPIDERRGVHFGGLSLNDNLRSSGWSDRDINLQRW